tara:strand:- start:2210 stop:2437 length:228 start_codon:yes stop_codon:yes gene_type:complete
MEDEILFADGFEEALVGIGSRCGQPDIAVYDSEKCVSILESQGMTYAEAWEFFDFNVVGAWVGERTPLFVGAKIS